MNRRRLGTALLIALAIALPVVYYLGGVSGFSKGFAAASFSHSGDAAQTVATLSALRAGDTAAAIDLLELQLDELVVSNNALGRSAFESSFNLPRIAGVGRAADVDTATGRAIAYRKEFPSRSNAAVRAAVDATLAQLARHPGVKP